MKEAYLHPKLKTRENYEDIFHDMMALELPNFKKSNIRPAYQPNVSPTGDNVVSDDFLSDGLKGFTNKSNFIYFTVNLDTPDTAGEPYIQSNGRIFYNRYMTLDIDVYGPNSNNYALIIKSLVVSDFIQMYLNNLGIYYYNDESITPFKEPIQNMFWERTNLKLIFNENIEIDPVMVSEQGDFGAEVKTNATV